MKVLMYPHVSELSKGESGIKRVVQAYFRYLPKYGISLVPPKSTTYDISAAHAGIAGSNCNVSHLHGLYWTADYQAWTDRDWETRDMQYLGRYLKYA